MRKHARQVNETDAVAYSHHFGGNVPPIVNDVLRSSGRPLDPSTRVLMEDRFGHDFSKVRVHSDPAAANSASAVNAQAYTVGSQIVFGAGRYSSDARGQHLLAHELTHVVQQSGAAKTSLQRAPLEEEDFHKPMIEEYRREHGLPPGGVDEFGKRVGPSDGEIKYILIPASRAAGGPSLPFCPSVANLEGNLDFKNEKTRKAFNDANCISSASQSMPPACQFTPAQNKALEEAQKTAKGRAERALNYINMGAEGKKMATSMARDLFESDPPTLKAVVGRITKLHDFLKTAKIDFAGRTCGDEECQRSKVAYVTGPGALPVYICPTAFSTPSRLHHTVLHEALHWTGLDADPSTPEGYCSKFDCKTPCLDKEVADAWAHYIDCLGKPFTIRKDFTDKMEESLRDLP
ncbi:MAG TPA: DUF4157 domain-containing protein [Pyrinomonadaceae bacterium]|nr:DUF4157 domain-containing protein [Pyrinomonadaceae bacterium]